MYLPIEEKDTSCLQIVLLVDIGMNELKFLEILIIFNNFIDMILIMAWQQSVHEQELISKPASTIKANLNMNEYIHH